MSINNSMLKFFQKYRLPLNRGDKDIYTFLSDHFTGFKKELNALLDQEIKNNTLENQIYDELRKRKEAVYSFSTAILDALSANQNGNILEAHQIFENKMNKIQNLIAVVNMKDSHPKSRYFRIRQDKGSSRKELFHIPFNEVEKVKACRYNITGFPCLYLAGSPSCSHTGLSLAWLESNSPSKFFWSEFELVDDLQNIKLIDLTASPFSSADRPGRLYRRIIEKDPYVKQDIIKFISTYPLIAACSLAVKDKDKPFSPEYVIPQMLLLWVHHNKSKYGGIKYFSCSRYKEAQKYNAFNVVMPPDKFLPSEEHCPKLTREFKVSKPRFVDVQEIFRSLFQNYNDVLCYRNELYESYRTRLATETIREILSLCDSFIHLYEKMHDGKMQDMSWTLQYIETLNLFASQIVGEKYHQLMLEEAKRFDTSDFENIDLCEKNWKDFQDIRMSIFSFWNFIDTELKMPKKPKFEFIC